MGRARRHSFVGIAVGRFVRDSGDGSKLLLLLDGLDIRRLLPILSAIAAFLRLMRLAGYKLESLEL